MEVWRGAKNMSIEVPSCNIRMIDSINFLHMALSKLPKMFGIKELQKGYFPHLYDRKNNQTSMLSHLPDTKFYYPDGMKSDDRETIESLAPLFSPENSHLQKSLAVFIPLNLISFFPHIPHLLCGVTSWLKHLRHTLWTIHKLGLCS
jgi:hypothetical protein